MQGPQLARQQLIPPAGRLDRGGLPQDGGAPRDRPSLDSAVACIGAESALAGPPTPTQGEQLRVYSLWTGTPKYQ